MRAGSRGEIITPLAHSLLTRGHRSPDGAPLNRLFIIEPDQLCWQECAVCHRAFKLLGVSHQTVCDRCLWVEAHPQIGRVVLPAIALSKRVATGLLLARRIVNRAVHWMAWAAASGIGICLALLALCFLCWLTYNVLTCGDPRLR